MNSFFRPSVDAMVGYVPSEFIPPGASVIKLNTNENPYPPSPDAIAVLRHLDPEWLRRYPDPYATQFRRAVSEVLAVPLDWIIVSNGSDDLLNLIVRSCAELGRRVVYPMPTYILYSTLTQMQPTERVEISYGEDYRFPIEELVAVNGAVTFIATPNSPSGHTVAIEELRQLATRLSGILVIDEAYVDFADTTALSLVKEFENVIVIRTLSKGYSLAGLRLGFGIANPQLLSGLYKLRDNYSIDAIACLVGAAAMRDQVYKRECVEKVMRSRLKLSEDFKRLGFWVRESQTNFLLVKPPKGNAEQIYLALKERGILVRYYQQPGLEDKLRVTVGTDEQNQILVEALIGLV